MEIPQMVNRKDLEHKVKEMYKKVAQYPNFDYHFQVGRTLALGLGYPAELLDQIPAAAIDSFVGVGYAFDLLNLQPGECALDLGSGSGMDVFCAAKVVGSTGEVIGLDMTCAQLNKSKSLQDSHGFSQVVFHESYIEQLPIVSGSIDAVTSNGVINLSLEKEKVFMEIARVLKPGARMAISDIVTTKILPVHVTSSADLWAACIGGAIPENRYLQLIEDAGLKIITIRDNAYEFISKNAIPASKEFGIASLSIFAVKE